MSKEKCKKCLGSGYADGISILCEQCEGTGNATMKKSLLSTTEYVLWIFKQDIKDMILEGQSWRNIILYKIRDHANLMIRKPQLGDFVPCNSKGEPMEEWKGNTQSRNIEREYRAEYQKALDNVLFKGWEIKIGYKTRRILAKKLKELQKKGYEEVTIIQIQGWMAQIKRDNQIKRRGL